jgi:hypothetical protein
MRRLLPYLTWNPQADSRGKLGDNSTVVKFRQKGKTDNTKIRSEPSGSTSHQIFSYIFEIIQCLHGRSMNTPLEPKRFSSGYSWIKLKPQHHSMHKNWISFYISTSAYTSKLQSFEAIMGMACCTSSRRKIFPAGDFGIAAMKATRRTFLYGATCQKIRPQCSVYSVDVMAWIYCRKMLSRMTAKILKYYAYIMDQLFLSKKMDQL